MGKTEQCRDWGLGEVPLAGWDIGKEARVALERLGQEWRGRETQAESPH